MEIIVFRHIEFLGLWRTQKGTGVEEEVTKEVGRVEERIIAIRIAFSSLLSQEFIIDDTLLDKASLRIFHHIVVAIVTHPPAKSHVRHISTAAAVSQLRNRWNTEQPVFV